MRKFFLLSLSCIFLFSIAKADSQKTQINFFSPFDNGKLISTINVTKELAGECYSSTANPRGNAWRCTAADGEIFDPCFNDSKNRNLLICMNSPWQKNAVEFNTKLPYIRVYRNGSPTDYQPWGIVLSNKIHCQLQNGATEAIGDDRISYVCDKNTYLTGDIDKSNKIWLVEWQHGYYTDWMEVTTAWY